MRLTTLIIESVRRAHMSRLTSSAITIVSLAMYITTFWLVGTNPARNVPDTNPGDVHGRRLVITDPHGDGFIDPNKTAMIATLAHVEHAISLDEPRTVFGDTFGPDEGRATAWRIAGTLDQAITMKSGRLPGAGEAILSEPALQQLGIAGHGTTVTTLTGIQFRVVGVYTAKPPFTDLNQGVLLGAGTTMHATQLRVTVDSPDKVSSTRQSVMDVLRPADPTRATVDVSIAPSMNAPQPLPKRWLIAGIFASGSVVLFTLVAADIARQRSPLRQQRALGATRSDTISMIVLRCTLPALAGTAAGAVAVVLISSITQAHLSISFSIAVALGTFVSAVLCSLIPAVGVTRGEPGGF